MGSADLLRVAEMIHDSIVDGPGLRYAIFTQGCNHGCGGCHNPETLDPGGGREVPVDEIIGDFLKNPLLSGVTLTGGEPFLQVNACAAVARAARKNGLNVWCYSGFTFEELLHMPSAAALLRELDVLVDGPFLLKRRSLSLTWRGSDNQRILDVKRSLIHNAAVELGV